MNKALHVLVYFFLILSIVALVFEIQLNDKRSLLTARNRMQENYIVKIAKTVEIGDPAKAPVLELKKDCDPVEAKIIDIPNTDNVLDDYKNQLEQSNLDTFSWDDSAHRQQLRMVYVLDAEGKIVYDGTEPVMTGPGTEDELLSQLFESAKKMQEKLNNTRAELAALRGKLETVVGEINDLKPKARQDKVTIVEKQEQIQKLEGEKSELENQITKLKAQIDELNAEITSLKDEVVTAKNETEEAKEELAKREKLIDQLKKMVQELMNKNVGEKGTGRAVASIPAGDKGKVTEADNENMFAIIDFTEEAIMQLKGNNPDAPLSALELGVRRPGFDGPAGEFVGRVKIRQEVKGQTFVICDILGNWEQAKLEPGDIIFAD